MRVVFIKVNRPPLEGVVCRAVQALVERGRKVVLFTRDREQATDLDRLLWTFSKGSFIAHRLLEPGEEPGPDEPEQALVTHTPVEWPAGTVLVQAGPAPTEYCAKFDLVVDFAPTYSGALVQPARNRFKAWRENGTIPDYYEGVDWLTRRSSSD